MAEALTLLRERGLPINAVVDVGVQHGTPFLMKTFPHLIHHLVEPIEEYLPKIEENYRGIDHRFYLAAASDKSGVMQIRSEKKSMGDMVSHSYLVSGGKREDTREVRVVRLDELLKDGIPDNTLLKVDVEGPDTPSAILRGAAGLASSFSCLIVEMTVDKFSDRCTTASALGFDLWDIVDLCYYDSVLWQADAVFVRRDLKAANMDLRPMHKGSFQAALWQSN